MSISLEWSDEVQLQVWDKLTPPQVDFTDIPKTNNHTSLQFPKTPLLLIKQFLKRYWTKIIENYILGDVNTTPTAPTRPTTLPCCSLLIKIWFIQLLYNVLKKYWIVSIVLVVLWHNLNMSATLTRCMVEKINLLIKRSLLKLIVQKRSELLITLFLLQPMIGRSFDSHPFRLL